jgi:hypothetical protein
MNDKLNRREFLEKLSMFGLGVIGAGGLMSACGKKEDQSQAPQTEEPAMEEMEEADPCADLSGLTEDEKQLRVTFEYVTESPDPEKLCSNCGFWIEPEGGSPCGGCKVIKGPFHPGGYCKSWAPKQA